MNNIVPLSNIKTLHLEIGLACNLRCIMCFQCNYEQKMAQKVWKEKLLPIYPTVKELIIQGGEVTMIAETRGLMRMVKKYNPDVKFGVMTNGLLFTDYWQEEFVVNGFMVNFSLNASNKEIHEKINTYSDFGKVMENLKNLIAKRNHAKSQLKIFISFVIIPENLHQLADFIELGKKLGVDRVRFFSDAANLPEATKEVEENVLKAWEVYRQKGIKIEGLAHFYRYYCHVKKIENKFSEQRDDADCSSFCSVPWNTIYVDHTGGVQTCCMSNINIGDLNKNNLQEIWNGKPIVKIRDAMANKKYDYCQLTCSLNQNPSYGFTWIKVNAYIKKFLTSFKLSPKTAYKKAVRKLRQFYT